MARNIRTGSVTRAQTSASAPPTVHKTPMKAVAALANEPNTIMLVVAKDGPIKSVADLKGKRLSVGAPRSGTELNTRAILGAAGLTYKDLGKIEYLPFGESVDLMKNRQLAKNPIHGAIASVSVGISNGVPVLDLDYAEDSTAETDANFVITGAGGLVEVQGTAEGAPFTEDQLGQLLRLARKGSSRRICSPTATGAALLSLSTRL